jgi:hypothetical protein
MDRYACGHVCVCVCGYVRESTYREVHNLLLQLLDEGCLTDGQVCVCACVCVFVCACVCSMKDV